MVKWELDRPTPEVGAWIVPDGWHLGGRLIASDWDKAQFRLPAPNTGCDLAVNVETTGRVIRSHGGIRVRITFVGDGEADRIRGGFMWPGK